MCTEALILYEKAVNFEFMLHVHATLQWIQRNVQRCNELMFILVACFPRWGTLYLTYQLLEQSSPVFIRKKS